MSNQSTYKAENYTILSDEEIALIYKNAFLGFKSEVEAFFNENKDSYPPLLNADVILHEMLKVKIYCSQFNIPSKKHLINVMRATSLNEIKKEIEKITNYAKEIREGFLNLENIGKAQRALYGITFPAIFERTGRVYLKTSPIFSETDLLQDIVNYLNHPLLKHEKFSFSVSQDDDTKRFWLHQKQPIKPVKKLLDLETECKRLLEILKNDELYLSDFLRFITKIPNNEKLGIYFNRFKKNRLFPPFRLDTVILRHLIAYNVKNKESLLASIELIATRLNTFRTSLHEMLIKPIQKNETNNGIDMIILSTNPGDISGMSLFADWESCMSSSGVYHQDVIMQITAGSIIAYGVNSKQPDKKLARALLKPYETPKTIKQREAYAQEIDFDFVMPDIEVNSLLLSDYKDMYTERDEVIRSDTLHLDEQDLVLDPENVERIYKIDKVYGLQNPQFLHILEEFAQNHISKKNLHGRVVIAQPMYLDRLAISYQLYDKYDKDNLVKFLTLNNHKYTFDDNNVIHTEYVNISEHPEVHLRPLSTNYLIINGSHLDKVHHDISAKRLYIHNPETYSGKTFPATLAVAGKIVFCKNKKSYDMPFQIKTRTLCAEGSRLISVAPDLAVSFLNISQTWVSTIPSLNLSGLDASRCFKLKSLHPDIIVKNKLDISYSGIEYLPALQTRYIIANGAKNLKKIDKNIKFSYLKAGGSGLESMPENLSAELFIASDTLITTVPAGTKIKELNLTKTPLTEIHPDVQIDILNISHTPIESLPSNLTLKKLDAFHCKNLEYLPPDIQVKECLILANTPIKELPVLDTEVIHVINCPNIKELPDGIKVSILWAQFSSIERLPKNITATVISCASSKLQKIPDNTTISSSFDARKTNLEEIGENVTIRHLDISATPIKSLPTSLKTEELVAIYCKQLTAIPPYLTVSKRLNISACTNIKELKNIKTKILNISICYNLKELDDTVMFNVLYANGSGLKKLPNSLTVDRIEISHCPIKNLPPYLKTDFLEAQDTHINEIPPTIEVKEANLDSTYVFVVPAGIKVEKLSLKNTPLSTIHYSQHLKKVIVNNPIKFIHPDLPTTCIIGMTEAEIIKAKARYKKTFKNVKIISADNTPSRE